MQKCRWLDLRKLSKSFDHQIVYGFGRGWVVQGQAGETRRIHSLAHTLHLMQELIHNLYHHGWPYSHIHLLGTSVERAFLRNMFLSQLLLPALIDCHSFVLSLITRSKV